MTFNERVSELPHELVRLFLVKKKGNKLNVLDSFSSQNRHNNRRKGDKLGSPPSSSQLKKLEK